MKTECNANKFVTFVSAHVVQLKPIKALPAVPSPKLKRNQDGFVTSLRVRSQAMDLTIGNLWFAFAVQATCVLHARAIMYPARLLAGCLSVDGSTTLRLRSAIFVETSFRF